MTDPDRPEPTDADLIALVRAGDPGAYEQLFVRHHDIALRYARRLAGPERADDLCAEAFAKILDLLQRGKGPEVTFRAYLLTTVRTNYLNTVRAGKHEHLVPDHEPVARMVPVTEDPDERFDAAAIHRAFSELPDRWQAALWLTEVEGLSNDEVGERLGIKANAVASLAFRARAGLRHAYLAEHLLETDDPRCRRTVVLLPSYARGTLTTRRRRQVEDHLGSCAGCTAAALELNHVDTKLGAALGPLALTTFAGSAVLVPVKGAGVVGLVAAAKVRLAGAFAHVKGLAAGAPLVSGTAVAGAAVVAAVGIAAAAHALTPHPRTPSALHEPVVTATDQPSAPVVVSPSAQPSPSGPTAVPVIPLPTSFLPLGPVATETVDGPGSVPTDAPTEVVDPPSPSSSPSGPSGPTAPPTSTPSAPPTTTAARDMAVGPMQNTRFQRNMTRWDRVSVPVTDPVAGTSLRLTSTRTYNAALAAGNTSGWTCTKPKLSWIDGTVFASSVTTCTYSGQGDGSPLKIEYAVGGGAKLTGQLTPPTGYVDQSPANNLATLNLLA